MSFQTYKIDKESLHDSWSDVYPEIKEQSFIDKVKQQLLNDLIKKLDISQLSIDEISKKVLEKTKKHEIKQTTHIIQNSKNIQEFSNMDVWDTYSN